MIVAHELIRRKQILKYYLYVSKLFAINISLFYTQ